MFFLIRKIDERVLEVKADIIAEHHCTVNCPVNLGVFVVVEVVRSRQ
jgi:hypothetical protein